jgi:uncharacterized DUF497 family protein
VSYEWDSKKASSNIRKHGIDFADVIPVFEDRAAVTIPDEAPTNSGSRQLVWTPC